MTSDVRCALVLWSTGFDAVVASTFISSLRSAGLRVKLVGLALHPSCGSLGLTLVPDLTLEGALPLATAARCVVLPCSSLAVPALALDPRVRDLLRMAQEVHAPVIISADSASALFDFGVLSRSCKDIVTFAFDGTLPGIVDRLGLPRIKKTNQFSFDHWIIRLMAVFDS